MTTELVHFSQARAALAKATKVDEVKQIRDKAEALRAYLKQAGESLEMQNQCGEIKLRAERRGGELLSETDKHKGGRPSKTSNTMLPVSTPTLEDLGIDKMESSRMQKIAAIPEKVFEQHIKEVQENREELTTAGLLRVAAGKPHVSHNAGDNEWYTPAEYAEAARDVLGSIDCDPASSSIANRTIKASHFFSAEQDGLKRKWGKRVWMNPPYAQPLIGQFCEALVSRIGSGEVESALVLVNNATETGWFQSVLEISSAACFIKGRVKFVDRDGNPGAPLQGQAVLYAGKNVDSFTSAFSKFGVVMIHA